MQYTTVSKTKAVCLSEVILSHFIKAWHKCREKQRCFHRGQADQKRLTFAVAHDGASSAPRRRRGFHSEPKPKSELA